MTDLALGNVLRICLVGSVDTGIWLSVSCVVSNLWDVDYSIVINDPVICLSCHVASLCKDRWPRDAVWLESLLDPRNGPHGFDAAFARLFWWLVIMTLCSRARLVRWFCQLRRWRETVRPRDANWTRRLLTRKVQNISSSWKVCWWKLPLIGEILRYFFKLLGPGKLLKQAEMFVG